MEKKFLLKELSRYKINTYADIIYRNALLYPDREAFIYASERITFSEFNARVNSLIHALRSLGVERYQAALVGGDHSVSDTSKTGRKPSFVFF